MSLNGDIVRGVLIIAKNGTVIAECKTQAMADKIISGLKLCKADETKRKDFEIKQQTQMRVGYWINKLYKRKTGSRYTEKGICGTDLMYAFISRTSASFTSVIVAENCGVKVNRASDFLRKMRKKGIIRETGEKAAYASICYSFVKVDKVVKVDPWSRFVRGLR